DSLLLVRGIVLAGDDLFVEQGLQPVGENVGGDAFLRFGQELAKMPPVAEHHVADDEQAPFVAEHFQREIDRAAGAAEVGHVRFQTGGEGTSKNCLQYCTSCLRIQPVANRNQFKG